MSSAVAVKVWKFWDLSRPFATCAVLAVLMTLAWGADAQEKAVEKKQPATEKVENVAAPAQPDAEGEKRADRADDKYRVGLVVESTSSAAKVYTAIPGAKKTVLAAAHEWQYGLRLFTDTEWRKREYDLEAFYDEAEKTADAVAEAMQPQLMRDSRDVVEYALIASDDVFLSSALTSKRFLRHFKDVLGSELRVIVVDRHILYVFPAVGGKLETYAPAIADIYRTTQFPGSLEIFQVTEKGYKVLGSIDS